MPGDNPALSHKYRLSFNGVTIGPIAVQASALASKQKTVELSDLHVLVTDLQESNEFTLTFDSDNRVDMLLMDAWKATRARWDATLQILANDGTTPVLIFQLQKMGVSDGKPTADLSIKESEPVNYEYTCHAKVTRLPS